MVLSLFSIERLQKYLNVTDDKVAEITLHKYFVSKETKFNNHSFAMYLLDQLITRYPEGGWNDYPAKNKDKSFSHKPSGTQ